MTPADISLLRPQILERRRRLESAVASRDAQYLHSLLSEVDAALQRMDQGTFGLCDACHEAIETDRLLADPLVRVCLDHLTARQRRELEVDIELATRIQARLLPPRELDAGPWDTHYYYQPAGAVSGDYCELLPQDKPGSLFFAVGDVSGKGVAASLLMTHLSAILRSLLSFNLPVPQMMARANRIFCESTLASQYATLICGRTNGGVGLEVSNAGHPPPLVTGRNGVQRLDSSGLPLGLFCASEYQTQAVALEPGESLFLYTDGLTEAHDADGHEFGEERLVHLLEQGRGLSARDLAASVLEPFSTFCGESPLSDDLTLLVIRRRA